MADFLPAIAPDQDRTCAVCGIKQSAMPGHEEHHLVARSLGGTETITLCVRCHNRTEGADPWQVRRSPDATRVYQGDTLLVERYHPPQGWDQGEFVRRLEAAPDELEMAAAKFRFLDDDGLIAAGQALYRLHYTGWVVRARLFQTAVLRTPYGDKTRKLKELAAQFSIGGRQAWTEIDALGVLDAHPVVRLAAQVPSPDLLVMAARAPDTEKALELLVDRRAANPGYTRETYRAELAAGKQSLDPEPAWCVCNACGHRHREKGDNA